MQANPAENSLDLLSFNIQAGTSTTRYRHYLTRGWRHVLPHRGRTRNLDAIAHLVSGYDLVALQEVDSGSLRSGFINQTKYLANHSDFPFWSHQPNRKIGTVAYAGNGLLTRVEPDELLNFRLPGPISARGALWARYGIGDASLVIVNLHLALAPRTRQAQLNFIAKRLEDVRHKIILGDLNTHARSAAMVRFIHSLDLDAPTIDMPTFPSWQPRHSIDHIMISREIEATDCRVLEMDCSDHRPISLRVNLPAALNEVFLQPARALAS